MLHMEQSDPANLGHSCEASDVNPLKETIDRIAKISPSGSDFRGDVPMYRAPDREEWERQHGVKPRAIIFGLPPDRPLWPNHGTEFVVCTPAALLRMRALENQARIQCQTESSTLVREEAIKAHVGLDSICEHMKYNLKLAETDEVFYDPNDGRFWIYPDRPSGSDT
jgi:hypothetical protein